MTQFITLTRCIGIVHILINIDDISMITQDEKDEDDPEFDGSWIKLKSNSKNFLVYENLDLIEILIQQAQSPKPKTK